MNWDTVKSEFEIGDKVVLKKDASHRKYCKIHISTRTGWSPDNIFTITHVSEGNRCVMQI